MIEKATELLEKFIKIEREKIESIDMPHMPTLGEAYEKLTQQGINQDYILPAQLNLRVVSGFISIDGKMLSLQIDGMLVMGDGKQYGATEHYIYPIDQVLCVLEIKKTLKKGDYRDAFDHLREIRLAYDSYFTRKVKNGFDPNITMASIHFSEITGRCGPRSYRERDVLDPEDQLLFDYLVREIHAPLSIVFGYDGYKTEGGMRKAFINILQEKETSDDKQIGLPYIPALVISGDFSIIKGNGVPYIMTLPEYENGVKKIGGISSSKYNPIYILLEIIWTKITFFCDLSINFGVDLIEESIVPLIIATPVVDGAFCGWVYELSLDYTGKELKQRESSSQWSPKKVDSIFEEFFFDVLIDGCIYSETIMEIATEKDIPHEELVSSIVQTLCFKEHVGNYHPIRNELIFLENNGSYYLSDDYKRMKNWCVVNSIDKGWLRWCRV